MSESGRSVETEIASLRESCATLQAAVSYLCGKLSEVQKARVDDKLKLDLAEIHIDAITSRQNELEEFVGTTLAELLDRALSGESEPSGLRLVEPPDAEGA